MDVFGRGSVSRIAAGGLLVLVTALAAACGEPPSEGTPDPSAGPGAPQVVCLGVPASKCRAFVEQAAANGGTTPLVGVRIVCSAGPCVERSGQVTIDAVYADGRRESSGSGWATAGGGAPPPVAVPPQPAPTLPAGVEPICVGLPAAQCTGMAVDVMLEATAGSTVVSIVVTCTTRCDATTGQGSTVVTYDDGTTTTHQWGYST